MFRSCGLVLAVGVVALSGCSEGPFWRTGHLSPWVQKKWAEETRFAPTLAVRKQQLRQTVDTAVSGPPAARSQAAELLNNIVETDPVLLVRIEAVKLLGRLPAENAATGLQVAMNDPEADVRKAAISAWQSISGEVAVENLQKMAASDTNLDVRLNATRALGKIGTASAVRALGLVLDDPDPAVQYRSTISLKEITGEKFGTDVAAWRQYVSTNFSNLPSQPVENNPTTMASEQPVNENLK